MNFNEFPFTGREKEILEEIRKTLKTIPLIPPTHLPPFSLQRLNDPFENGTYSDSGSEVGIDISSIDSLTRKLKKEKKKRRQAPLLITGDMNNQTMKDIRNQLNSRLSLGAVFPVVATIPGVRIIESEFIERNNVFLLDYDQNNRPILSQIIAK